MDAAKSGGHEVRAGEVFVECSEKTGFPGFGFFRRGDNCALRGEDGSQRGKCNSQDQRMAAGCILTGIRDLKWKFRINGLERVFNRAIVALKQENPESFNHAPQCRPLSFCLAAINPGVCGQEREGGQEKRADVHMMHRPLYFQVL